MKTKPKPRPKRRINSKRKGKDGEQEAANVLSEIFGVSCRRGQQFSGLEGKDVVGLPGLHVEVKRVEKLCLYDSLDQATRDAAEGELPIVVHRPSGKPWVAIVELTKLPQLATLLFLTRAAQ